MWNDHVTCQAYRVVSMPAGGNLSDKNKFQNLAVSFHANTASVWTPNFKYKACWHTGFVINLCYIMLHAIYYHDILKVFLSQKQNSSYFLKLPLLLQDCQEKSYRLIIKVCAFHHWNDTVSVLNGVSH